MGKDDKEETGFGFKDREKALETLRLLEDKEPQYRRLTVRGLLGRAKRVLSLTKAEEKIKNIKEAMEVFENWLAELDKDKQSKDSKKKEDKKPSKKEGSSDKESEKETGENKKNSGSKDVEMSEDNKASSATSDTVPGLGFKDKATAEQTLEALDGRDPDYQKLAIKGLIGRAKRVLTCTKDESKVNNIKEAMSIFEKFLDDFDSLHLSKQNNSYVSLYVVEGCQKLAKKRDLEFPEQEKFIAAYDRVNGDYKKLRTVESDSKVTWDIVRNRALKELKEKVKDAKLWGSDGMPTDEHLPLLLWAYSPDESRAKRLSFKEERKRHASSSSEDEETSPSKKTKQ